MPFDFTEADFAPKSKFDFTEEDFTTPPPVQEQGSLIGKSKDELSQLAKRLRVERNLGELEQGATDVATGFLSIPGSIGSKIFNIPTELPKSVSKEYIDAQKVKQTLDPITEAWGMSGEPITEATKEFAAETAAGLSTPEAAGIMATGPAAPAIFAAQMAKGAPEAIQRLNEVSKTGDEKETAKAFLNAALSIGGPIEIARQAGLVKEPATDVAQPKETDARTQQEAATVHGDVLPLPVEGEGKVPVKEGEPRVQPQAEGGIPEKEVTPASTLESVIRDPAQRANNKNSTEAGLAVKSVADLDSLVDLRKRLLTESKELFKKSEAETDPAKKMELMNQGALIGVKSQLPREAIEVATNFGGWEEGKGTIPHKLGERPLDYSKNPEVIDWLHKNKDIFSSGVELPKKVEKATAPEPTETVLASQKESDLKKTGESESKEHDEEFDKLKRLSMAGPGFGETNEIISDALDDPEVKRMYKAYTNKLKSVDSYNNIFMLFRDGAKTENENSLVNYIRRNHPDFAEHLFLREAAQAGGDLAINQLKKVYALEQLKKIGLSDYGTLPLDDWKEYRESVWNQSPGLAHWIEQNLFKGKDFGPLTEESTLESRSKPTPTHGLPPGVPDRGPSFAADLMEASRQLGALVRSRATLRPGVLGQFVRSKLAGIKQADRIEVGDIRNQATVAHEIGHSLDGILFPDQNFGESQKSLAARVGTGTGKELASELTKVSELMRGPITGSKGHVAYRKRATELLADYFSLYAHDRDRAAAMAPKFTKGFEAALAKDQNTADVVKGVVSGNVVPKPPSPTLPKALAGITGTPPQPGTKIPGQVPAPPQLPPPARERIAAVAAEGLVKDAVRTFESKVQKARIVGDDWRKRVASQSDRNDVGAFVEGIGNLEKPGDTIDRVRNRMTPAKERLAKDYRFRQELERQEINSYLKDTEEGEYLKFLEDYLGHFYVDSTAKRQAAVSRWAKESPHAKQRKIPTLKEAVDLGLTPITQDPAVTYELNSRINWQVATNRKFVASLKDIKTGGGGDVVVPAKDAPAGWPVTNNPLIQRVYARQTPSGLMLWRGGAAIHPDVWRAARQILEAPIAGDLGKAYDAINGFTRANAFAFSMFHDLTLRSAAIGSQASPLNPLRGLFRVMEQHPITGERKLISSTRGLGKELLQNEEAVADAAQHGLKFSYTDSEAYQHNARTFLERRAATWRDVPVLGKATRLARDLQQWRQEGLWKNTHDAFKIITYHDLVSKALQDAPPGTDTKAVKEQIASYLNDAYGGQEWQTKFWLDPGTRKVVSRFFLAPDWTLSTIRSVPGISDVASTVREQAPRIAGREAFPTPKEGLGGAGRRLRFWGSEIAALAMATAAAQYAIYKTFGDDKKGDKAFPWDNELNQKMRIDVTPLMRKLPWADPKDPTRHYVNLGKRPQEILNWFTEPDKQVMSKASRPVAIIFEQVTGSEGDFKAPWKQDHESFIESVGSRAKAIGTEALPFTFRGNQFALSAPVRKGMTKYKAQQAYESVFELATNPSRIRSLLRGQAPSEGTIPEMASQITDAAHRNGVPAEELMVRALSTVRGHHYNEFFKAFQKGDQKKMDEEAKALLVLGATDKGIEESLKRRMELQPVEP